MSTGVTFFSLWKPIGNLSGDVSCRAERVRTVVLTYSVGRAWEGAFVFWLIGGGGGDSDGISVQPSNSVALGSVVCICVKFSIRTIQILQHSRVFSDGRME